ncbi:hypothetical protein IFR05_002424 [Cadophora sp. M221]|nr:hypothetical protein IFR05_002424 [Cadophora sp. M221]
MHSTLKLVAVLALFFINTALSQNLNSKIVGCTSKCTVIDKTFPNIGLARIPITSQSPTGLSWTEGISINSANDKRTFEKTFYLGTPPKTSLTGTGACAVFFNQVSKKVTFGNSDVEDAQGTCQEALNAQCVGALVARAEKVDVAGLGSAEACMKLESAFKETVDFARVGFADGDRWTGVSVKPLTGSEAAIPITSSQNSTSSYWPIIPREYDSALVTSIQTALRLNSALQGDFSILTASENIFGIVPILTLFYPATAHSSPKPKRK